MIRFWTNQSTNFLKWIERFSYLMTVRRMRVSSEYLNVKGHVIECKIIEAQRRQHAAIHSAIAHTIQSMN